MLVPSMTLNEMYDELYRDYSDIVDRLPRWIAAFRRPAMKALRFPFRMNFEYEGKHTRNRFKVIFTAECHANFDNPRVNIYTTFRHEGGVSAVLLMNHADGVMKMFFYTPHCLNRYAERRMKDRSITIDECIRDICLNNDNMPFDKDGSCGRYLRLDDKYYQGDDIIYFAARTLDGMFICEQEKRKPQITVCNTFVPIEMLKQEQIEKSYRDCITTRKMSIARRYPRFADRVNAEIEALYDRAHSENWDAKRILAEADKVLSPFEK